MLQILLQATPADNAVNGKLGACLDSLVVMGETMVWGGTMSDGTTTFWAGGVMLNVAAALGAVFSILLAARIAFKTMAEGERFEVLEILKPILIALLLANWYGICSGIYHIFKPVENRFRAVYEWNNERVDSLRLRRDTLTFVMKGEIEQAKVELIMSEIRQRWGVEEEEEEKKEPDYTSGVVGGQQVSVQVVEFGDILNDDANVEYDEDGNQVFKPDIRELMENAGRFDWMEKIIKWIAEVIWSVMLYFIFIVKYVFLYVLVMFGPVWFVCSILDVWEDKWAEWIGKFVVVSLYGAAAYLCLTFGLMIIESTTRADIRVYETAMLSDEKFYSYLQMTSRFNGLGSVGMYFIALLVTVTALPMSFELAGLAFPGNIGRGVGEFYKGMVNFVHYKVQQTKEAAVGAVLTAVTAGVASAAGAAAAKMEKEIDKEMQDKMQDSLPDGGDESGLVPDGLAPDSVRGRTDEAAAGFDGESPADEWIDKMNDYEREQEEKAELEQMLGGPGSDAVVLDKLGKIAQMWADRMTWNDLLGKKYKLSGEDLAAQMRDRDAMVESRNRGFGKAFDTARWMRHRENAFLLQVVRAGGMTNSMLTKEQEKLIDEYGLEKAMKKDKSLRYKVFYAMPRLMTTDALFDRDKMQSPREHRKILKEMGLYKHALRAEFLRKLANSLIRPGRVEKTKLFHFFTIHTKDSTYRNALQRKYYNRTMSRLLKLEAFMAMRCREELAKRDIHVDVKGEPVQIRGIKPYWQDNIDFATYAKVHLNGSAEFNNSYLRWFNERYGDLGEARKLQMHLMVFEAKKKAGDADDFVLERRMEARDETEMNLWKQIDEDFETYRRVKDAVESILNK